MIFNQAVYANKVCYSLPVLSVLGNTALPFVPLTKTMIAGEVTGPLFAGDVTHLFRYTAEQCDQIIEALYRFPLPGDAAVTGVTVRFGDREIEAVLVCRLRWRPALSAAMRGEGMLREIR